YNASASNMTFYVDGNSVDSKAVPTRGLRLSSAIVALGNKRSGVGPDFDLGYNGTLDEVAIYNYPLSLAQILDHLGAAYGPSTKPFITSQPASVTNYVSYPLSLRVGAAGTIPLSYQWRRNGADIPGATAPTYVIVGQRENPPGPGLQLTDAGSYTVVITNPVPGAITSAVAGVTGLSAPPTPAGVRWPGVPLGPENQLSGF